MNGLFRLLVGIPMDTPGYLGPGHVYSCADLLIRQRLLSLFMLPPWVPS